MKITPFTRGDVVHLPGTDMRAQASNFGRPWHGVTEERLALLFKAGAPVEYLCRQFGRDVGGITAKLQKLGLIATNYRTLEGYIYDCDYEPLEPTTSTTATFCGPETNLHNLPKENTMAQQPTIETKTFILGTDASTMTDAQIFNLIAKTEGELEKLKAIKTKSTKLTAHIKQVQADLAALAAYLDSRE